MNETEMKEQLKHYNFPANAKIGDQFLIEGPFIVTYTGPIDEQDHKEMEKLND